METIDLYSQLFNKPSSKFVYVIKDYGDQSAIALCNCPLDESVQRALTADCPDNQEAFVNAAPTLMEDYDCLIALSKVPWPVGSMVVLTDCYASNYSIQEQDNGNVSIKRVPLVLGERL